jgi:hypothetical protein
MKYYVRTRIYVIYNSYVHFACCYCVQLQHFLYTMHIFSFLLLLYSTLPSGMCYYEFIYLYVVNKMLYNHCLGPGRITFSSPLHETSTILKWNMISICKFKIILYLSILLHWYITQDLITVYNATLYVNFNNTTAFDSLKLVKML